MESVVLSVVAGLQGLIAAIGVFQIKFDINVAQRLSVVEEQLKELNGED